MEKTKEALAGYKLTIQAWCDSQVVLAWLQGDASRWDKYVSNRVDKIKQIIPADKWRYVKSAQNPADCASRGMLPSKLEHFDLWWQGPEFLKGAEDCSLMRNSTCLFTNDQESVNLAVATTTVPKNNEHFIHNLLHKYSSLTQVIRVTAQVLRFVATARSKMKYETNYLSVSELKLAADRVITYVQSTEFENEYKQLKANDPVNMIEQLTEIAGKLPRTSSLPVRNIRNDIKDIYKLLYVRARVTTNYFLFEIHVPLISDEDFTLYQATPLPMKTSTGTVIVQLASQYIAVNFGKSTYVSLSEDDMKRCSHIQPGNLICNKNLPIFNLHNSNAPCEAKLLGHRTTSPCDVKNVLCKQEWIALHTANTWLAICCGTCTIRIVCENDITTHSMTSGILTLAQGCLVQSKELTIHSHNQYNSNMKMDLSMNIPSLNSMVNNIVNITHNMSHVMLPETAELEEIDKRLAIMKTQENHLPSTISTHDIHQYAVCYTIVGVIITVSVGWLVKKYGPSCRSKQTKSHSTRNNQLEEIELQVIQHRRQEDNIQTASQAELQGERPRHADNIAFNFD